MDTTDRTIVPFLAGLLLAGTSRYLAEELAKRGVDAQLIPAHGNILVPLFGGGPMTLTELAQRAGRSKSTVSVMADKLEKAGYLVREPDPYDARSVLVRLTERGEELENTFIEISVGMHEKLVGELGEKSLNDLELLLTQAVQAFETQDDDEDFRGPMANA